MTTYTPIKNAGSQHGLSKWTEDQVLALRAEHAEIIQQRGRSHGSITELARRHPNMSRQSIDFIIRRKTWRHI